jgi:two-component system, sporulation sensor kinase E
MKSKLKVKGLIILLIIVISLLHYFGGGKDLPLHSFYRLLYYIPIILAAFNFGFRGGVFASLAVSLIYSPFILLTLRSFNAQTINEFLDIVLFFAVGIITGTLVEKKNLSLKRLDEELNRYIFLENYTNSIIESIKSGVLAVNSDMLITMANQGSKIMLGVEGDCIGQNFIEAFACCGSVTNKIKMSFKNDKPSDSIELTVKIKDTEKDIRINTYPLNFGSVKKGLVIIIDDITEVKKLQRELMRSEKLAALGELSSGVAHEIRNPLGIIKAIEQTMKKELEGNQEAIKELEIIDEEVERANKVVKALMEFGRPAKGEKIIYSMDYVVEDVLTVANKYITQHKVNVRYNKSGDSSCIIDKELIKQAFINIIFNAVQAMPDGGELTISILNVHGLFVKIIFEDTGTGIKPENLDKIFNPFYTTKEEGTGLGLSIVHNIIKDHNGTISVFSKEGIGTKFEIALPIRMETNI